MARSSRTFTGVVVVVTAAAVAVLLVSGALWAYLIAKDNEVGRELLVQGVASLGVLTALAARTRPDPVPIGAVEVTGQAGAPVVVEAVVSDNAPPPDHND